MSSYTCAGFLVRRLLLGFITAALPLVASSQIYKWTDEHGHVHYSDKRPQEKMAEEILLDSTNIQSSDSQEVWDFEFDGRRWELGHQGRGQNSTIREYVLQKQSMESWTELVTSQHMTTPISVEEYFERLTRDNPDCPSLEVSVVDDKKGNIIFSGKHETCGGYAPGEFIQRLSQIDGGIAILSFAQKEAIQSENMDNWVLILRNAEPKYVKKNTASEPQSLTLSELGPLPENSVSEYLETLSTSIAVNIPKRSGQLTIMLKARKGVPRGAYLEVHFPDPSDLDKINIQSKVLSAGKKEAFFKSPAHQDLKCWNYEVLAYVFRGDSKTKLLGTHRQTIQSRINYDRIKDAKDWVDASTKGRCP